VTLVFLPPHKFMCLQYCYCRLYKIKKYEVGVTPRGIMLIPYFVKISHLIQTLEQRHVCACTHTRSLVISKAYFLLLLRKGSSLKICVNLLHVSIKLEQQRNISVKFIKCWWGWISLLPPQPDVPVEVNILILI
jgi:hypothetical protein